MFGFAGAVGAAFPENGRLKTVALRPASFIKFCRMFIMTASCQVFARRHPVLQRLDVFLMFLYLDIIPKTHPTPVAF